MLYPPVVTPLIFDQEVMNPGNNYNPMTGVYIAPLDGSNKYLRLHLRLLFVMLEVSKALYTYMNRMKPLYTQILQWHPHYLIQSRSQYNSNFNLK